MTARFQTGALAFMPLRLGLFEEEQSDYQIQITFLQRPDAHASLRWSPSEIDNRCKVSIVNAQAIAAPQNGNHRILDKIQ